MSVLRPFSIGLGRSAKLSNRRRWALCALRGRIRFPSLARTTLNLFGFFLVISLPANELRAAEEVYVARQLDGGRTYLDLGGVSFGGVSDSATQALSASLDQDFSFGHISGSANTVIIPSKKICVFGKCWRTPEVTADTRSGVEMSGSIGGFATIGTDFDWQSGGFDAQIAAGLAGNAILPEITYAYDSFRPTAELDWRNDTQLTATLPGVSFDPYFGLGLHFDAEVNGALPGLGLSGFGLPTIDFSLPRLGLSVPGVPDVFDLVNQRDDVAAEYKILAGLTEVASIQRLRVLNEAFVDEVNAKKDALSSLQTDLNNALVLLDPQRGITHEQAKTLADTLGGWILAGQEKAAPSTALNLLLQKRDLREAFVDQLSTGLGEAAGIAGAEAKDRLLSVKSRLESVMSGIKEEMFTDNVETSLFVSGGTVAGKLRWDMVDFDLDLDGLANLVTPIPTSLNSTNSLGPLGNLRTSFDLLDFKMGPKFGLETEFSSELKETAYSWTTGREVVVSDDAGINIGRAFKTNDGSDTSIQLLGASPVEFDVSLDGLRQDNHFGLDLIISDLGTLEMEALGGFDLRFTSGIGQRINKILPRWDESVIAGQFPLAEFEFAMDLLDLNDTRTIDDLNLDLGRTTLTPQDRPVVPLIMDRYQVSSANRPPTIDQNDVSPVYEDVLDALNAARDLDGVNHGGRPSGIARDFEELWLHTQTENYDGNRYDLSWGLGQSVSPNDGIGSLWDEIGNNQRQLVIAYRNNPRDAKEDLSPMSLWLYDFLKASQGSGKDVASIKVIEGSHLRLEPVGIRGGQGFFEQEIHTPFIENDGLISLVGEAQRDLTNEYGNWRGAMHEVGLQGVKDAGITSLVLEGSGEIAMQGLAWLGAASWHSFAEYWEGNDTLFNVDGHRISGRHGLSDARLRTDWLRFRTYVDDGIPNDAKHAPSVFATGLIYNEGSIVATGHDQPDSHTDLTVYSLENLVNKGLLGSEGGNLAVHARTGISSSGQILAQGGRVDITDNIEGYQGPRDPTIQRAPSARLENSGMIAARAGGLVNIKVNDFDNRGGSIEATGGGRVDIAGLEHSILGDGSVLIADGPGARIALMRQSHTDGGDGVIGVNAFNDAHIVLHGLQKAAADEQTRVLFDVDGGMLELAGGVFDTSNYLLRSTGTLKLGEDVSASFVHVPDQVTQVDGRSVVDLDLGRVLVRNGASLDLDLVNPEDSSTLGDDILVRNRSRYTELSGSGRIGYLQNMSQLMGSLSLLDGAELRTLGDLTVTQGNHPSMQIRLEGDSLLQVGGELTMGLGTRLQGMDSRLEVERGRVVVSGADINVASTNLLQAGALAGDWEVSEVLHSDGSHTGGSVDLSGQVERLTGSLRLSGANTSFSGLDALAQIDGALILAGGADLAVADVLTNQSGGQIEIDGSRLTAESGFVSMVGSRIQIMGQGALETADVAVFGDLRLDDGEITTSRRRQDGELELGRIAIHRGASVSGEGRLNGLVALDGGLNVGANDGHSKLVINGGLTFLDELLEPPMRRAVLPDPPNGTVEVITTEAASGDVSGPGLTLGIGGTREGEYDHMDIFGTLALTGVLDSGGLIQPSGEGVYQSVVNLVFDDLFDVVDETELVAISVNGFGDDPLDPGSRTGYFDRVNLTWNGTLHSLTSLHSRNDLVHLGLFDGTGIWLDYGAGDGNDIGLRFNTTGSTGVPAPGTLLLMLAALWWLLMPRHLLFATRK